MLTYRCLSVPLPESKTRGLLGVFLKAIFLNLLNVAQIYYCQAYHCRPYKMTPYHHYQVYLGVLPPLYPD